MRFPCIILALTLATAARAQSGSLALSRLTPEQAANAIVRALGVTLNAKDRDGTDSDQFRVTYNVALGGVDFAPTRVRDPSAKVQTILITKTLAWKVATTLVGNELKAPVVFAKCDLKKDRPGADLASEQRWTAQVTEIYWRLFSRPPTADEMGLMKSTFVTVYTAEKKSTTKAWMALVYVLLSTAEFWHS